MYTEYNFIHRKVANKNKIQQDKDKHLNNLIIVFLAILSIPYIITTYNQFRYQVKMNTQVLNRLKRRDLGDLSERS